MLKKLLQLQRGKKIEDELTRWKFLCCFFFYYVSVKFHLWLSSGDLPRPQIGMLSVVTISTVITAFHSCCLLLEIRLQDSAFLSEVELNHLKKARGEIWPKRSEEDTTKKNYQDEDKKSAINKKLTVKVVFHIRKVKESWPPWLDKYTNIIRISETPGCSYSTRLCKLAWDWVYP